VILLHLALAFVAGTWLAAVERLLVVRFGVGPDLAAVALALLLTTLPKRSSQARANGVRACGLLLGFSTSSLDPLGVWLLGGGVAAAALLPLRDVLFIESPGSQFLFGLLCSFAFAGARALYALFGQGPLLPFTLADFAPPLLAGVAVPILRALLHFAVRGWRRLFARWEARRRGGETPAAG
jgi:hypothetical protein